MKPTDLPKILFGTLAITSCQSRNFIVSEPEVVPYFTPEPTNIMPEFPAVREESSLARKVTPSFDPAQFSEHPSVKMWIRYFEGKGKDRLQRFLVRGAPYRTFIEATLSKENMPLFLYFVPVIESGFNLKARSRASAVGPWQFMSGTARRFGLQVSHFVDERRDIYRSTNTACLYLKRLFKVFNSWPLALAAYNAGESRVMNSILKTGTRDFWALSRKKALPKETRNYVPKFIAAFLLAQRKDFMPTTIATQPPVTSISFPPLLSLAKIAKTIQIPLKELKKYNPHLKRNITPPGKKSYRLWLPESLKPGPELISRLEKQKPVTGRVAVRHEVKSGESLYRIARKYGARISQLKKLNSIRGSHIKPGQILVVPSRAPKVSLVKYKVRKGDNLILLARRFGMTVRKLKKINSISRSRIYAGQVLLVKSAENYSTSI